MDAIQISVFLSALKGKAKRYKHTHIDSWDKMSDMLGLVYKLNIIDRTHFHCLEKAPYVAEATGAWQREQNELSNPD